MIRVITLALDADARTFDETALAAAQDGAEVVSWDWRLVEDARGPLLVVVMETVPKRVHGAAPTASASPGPAAADPGEGRRGAYRDVVPGDRWELFHLLREWRNSRARDLGVSPYVILTNMELAQICREIPMSIAALSGIRGIGDAKLKKYGSEIIDIIARWRSRAGLEIPAGGEDPERTEGAEGRDG